MQILAEGIVERGRGPEIIDSRITVYDVFDEMNAGRTVAQLAAEWRLTVQQIECAARYIADHREEVVRDFAEIRAWHARERVFAEEKLRNLKRTVPPKNPEMRAKFLLLKAEWEARRAWQPSGSQSRRPDETDLPHPRKSDVA